MTNLKVEYFNLFSDNVNKYKKQLTHFASCRIDLPGPNIKMVEPVRKQRQLKNEETVNEY